MRRSLIAASVAALLLAAGCSSGSNQPPPPPNQSSPAASPTPSVAACPAGTYRVTALEGRGSWAKLGKGTGGNIDATFDAGTFTFTSAGSDPIHLELGGRSADLRLNGTISGPYTGESDTLQLTVGEASGDVTIKGFGVSRTFSSRQVADQLIGAQTTARATCRPDGTADLDLPRLHLALAQS